MHYAKPIQYYDAQDQEVSSVRHRAAYLRRTTVAEVVRRHIDTIIAMRWDHHRLARY